jgi:hypothetical protein
VESEGLTRLPVLVDSVSLVLGEPRDPSRRKKQHRASGRHLYNKDN